MCCLGPDLCPSNIFTWKGTDIPQYANVQYPWEGHEEVHPGEIPEQFNPVKLSYVKYFRLPKELEGKECLFLFRE